MTACVQNARNKGCRYERGLGRLGAAVVDADSRVAVGIRRSDRDQRAGAANLVSTRLASYPSRGRRYGPVILIPSEVGGVVTRAGSKKESEKNLTCINVAGRRVLTCINACRSGWVLDSRGIMDAWQVGASGGRQGQRCYLTTG